MDMSIRFPHLGITLPHVGKTITVFGFDIAYYGMVIALAMIVGISIAMKEAKRTGQNPDTYLDMLMITMVTSVIGARAYYVIFSWEDYKDDLLQIFNTRNGGLAIHGGIIAGFIVGLLVCKYHKIDILELADLVFPTVALAQAIGRWGNFFNSEAHGGPTDLPWAVWADGQYVHPTFLYESLWCFALFWFLLWLDKRRAFPGQIACLYGMLYSLERGLVEQLRTDSLMIGSFKQAQVLSFFVFVLCLALYIILRNKRKRS